MRQSNKKESGLAHLGIILAVILVVAAVAFGGWWVWDKQTNNSPSTRQSENQIQEEQKTAAPEGWKQYKNSEAGFSFYYTPEWGGVTQPLVAGESFKFTSLDHLKFSIHERKRTVDSLEFGNIEPAVIDVFLENNKPVVTLASGFETFREFTNDQIVKRLGENKICLAEDYHAEDYVESPNQEYGYTFFGYCGLIDDKFGAFTISSGQQDGRKPETQTLKENIGRSLKTFEVF